MSKEILQDQELLMLLGKKTAEERLATLLLSLSTRFRERGFSATEFRLSMSRNDIGNYLGLAVETVSRLFTRFQEQGLLEANGKSVHLLDLDALKALVASCGANQTNPATA
jgi:CRP/FNR family transcriptional regulator